MMIKDITVKYFLFYFNTNVKIKNVSIILLEVIKAIIVLLIFLINSFIDEFILLCYMSTATIFRVI